MPLRAQHGVDFIIETLGAAEPGSITLAALGPLTDIAMALVKAPDIAAGIGELVVMGGAGFEIGNVTPAANSTSMSIRMRPRSCSSSASRSR